MVIRNEKIISSNFIMILFEKRCFVYTPFAVRGCIETETESEWQRHA